MGSPKVRIQEYDLATRVPQYRGVVGAGVIDARKGPVNKPVYISSSTECINTFGTPNPKKYGLGVYSCLNFLETGPMWMTRVDKGQLFSSALVRSKIYPIVELDGYGYYMAKPQVDPIVYPLGPLSQHQIDIYEFQQYPRTRKVSSFLPEVHLADRPYAGDATITVDDTFPIVEGKKITFKDTTGMTREESMRFATYTVIAKERVIERTEMLVLDTEVLPYSFDSKLKACRRNGLSTIWSSD
jgi:hypothetical protein